MDFDQYQSESRKTAIYPNLGNNHIYCVLGLCGESGEIAEKTKKIMRDKAGHIDEETRDLLKKELGDVLWYLANLSAELQLSLSDIARCNIEKLQSRKDRGKLQGSGDNR